MLIVKKDALLKLNVYDNWDILYCKQHISDLFTEKDKNRLSQFASETTKSSYWWQAMQHTTWAIKAFLIYMGIIEIIFNLM